MAIKNLNSRNFKKFIFNEKNPGQELIIENVEQVKSGDETLILNEKTSNDTIINLRINNKPTEYIEISNPNLSDQRYPLSLESQLF